MVKGRASPDDPDLAGYWRYRRDKNGTPLDSSTANLLARQCNRCPHCGDRLLGPGHLLGSPEEWQDWWLGVTQRVTGRPTRPGSVDIPGGELPELDVSQPLPQRLDGVPVELPGPVRPAAQSARQPVIQRVADRVGHAGPDSVVQLLTQPPELGLDGGLRPAGHGLSDALARLVPRETAPTQWLLA